MKFIAILRDSLRETLDVKLFYVMVVLSLLTVLLVFSVTYTPAPMEKQLNFIANLLNFQLSTNPNLAKLNFRLDIENFERTDKRVEPWLGDYTFDYVVRWNLPDDVQLNEQERKQFARAREQIRRTVSVDTLQGGFGRIFREATVTEVKSKKAQPERGDEIVYHVVGKGTKVKSRQEWPHEPALFFGLLPIPVPIVPLSDILRFIGDKVIGAFGGAFTLLISIIITASFLPSMLAKGTVDLLLVKPIHRVSLFVEKFLGGLMFMFLNTVIIMTGVWLAIGLRTGTWVSALLVCIFIYTFQFAIFYAMSALTAVLTRSTIVCILVSFMTWGVLFIMGWAHWIFIEGRRADAPEETKNHWAFVTYDTIYTISPRYKDIDWLTSKMIETELIQLRDEPPPDSKDEDAVTEYKQRKEQAKKTYDEQMKAIDKKYGTYRWSSSLLVTSLFIAFVLGLACWRFAVKDY